jgi:hypothetical protein
MGFKPGVTDPLLSFREHSLENIYVSASLNRSQFVASLPTRGDRPQPPGDSGIGSAERGTVVAASSH